MFSLLSGCVIYNEYANTLSNDGMADRHMVITYHACRAIKILKIICLALFSINLLC
jgi:hypothetical protein